MENFKIDSIKLKEVETSISQLSTQTVKIETAPLITDINTFTISSGGVWLYNANEASALIRVKSGDVVTIKTTSAGAYYSVLSTFAGAVNGATPDYATGYTGYVGISTNATVEVTIPSDGSYLWLFKNSGSVVFLPNSISINGFDAYKSLKDAIGSNTEELEIVHGEIDDTNNRITKLKDIDLAKGNLESISSYTDGVIDYTSITEYNLVAPKRRNIVAISHDDLMPSDYLTTRKIYNKYGFRANFNFILKPFTTSNQAVMIDNVKKMLADGNEIGLHAIFDESFWWINKLYDVRPSYGFTYAPTLAEVTSVVSDSKNVFGYDVSGSKTLANVGFRDPPSAYASVLITNLTGSDYISVIAHYTLAFNNSLITGLDLNGNTQSWSMLKWLEYWYNELIDNTLGYSNRSSLSAFYSEGYQIPDGGSAETYYPDVTHLANGKIVFFDDTTNPNYSDAAYQKVGKFSKGLFKGHATCMNYEVRERCIQIAKAFCKHYFGTDKFTNYGKHGVTYVTANWTDSGYVYDNRDKNILAGEFGKALNTASGKYENGFDVLLKNGIKMTSHNTPGLLRQSQVGLYYGQENIRSPYFNHADVVNYLTLMGSGNLFSGETVTYETVMKIMGDKENPLKYAYENAWSQVTSTDLTTTKYIHPYLKFCIDKIRGCKDTGKIPVFSLDTIVNDAANAFAVELLCQFCYKNDFEIVPYEYARKVALSTPRDFRTNYFPNPNFTQMLLNSFGESVNPDVYIPDGWEIYNSNGSTSYSVALENSKRVFTITSSGTGYAYLSSRIYGLPAGSYQLTFYAKQSGSDGKVNIYKKINADDYSQNTPIANGSIIPSASYQLYTVEFEIQEPYCKPSTGGISNQFCQGYEDNTSLLMLLMGFTHQDTSEKTISIYEPKIALIS